MEDMAERRSVVTFVVDSLASVIHLRLGCKIPFASSVLLKVDTGRHVDCMFTEKLDVYVLTTGRRLKLIPTRGS